MDGSQLAKLFEEARSRYEARDEVGQQIRRIAANQFDDHSFSELAVSDDDQSVVTNLISSGARLIAQRIGGNPRVLVTAKSSGDAAARRAEKHEQSLRDILDRQGWDAKQGQAAYWEVLHDVTVYTTGVGSKYPIIRVRDPLTYYPETFLPDVDFQNHLFVTTLPYEVAKRLVGFAEPRHQNKPLTVATVELYTHDGLHLWCPDMDKNAVKHLEYPCPGKFVHAAAGFITEVSPQGQFDHAVGATFLMSRLQHMVASYAAQQVFAETNITGEDPEITSNDGKYAQGPGAVNVIRGGVANKSTNNMSVQVLQEIDRLERSVRVVSGYPTQLSGEPAGSYVTGRGTEALMTQVDDNLKYHHQIMRRALRSALEGIPDLCEAMGAAYTFADDVDVDVRFHAGADPATTIRNLQLQGAGLIAKKTVRDSLPDVQDALAEEDAIVVEALRDSFVAKAAADIQQGGLTAAQIARLITLKRKGKPLEEAMEKIEEEAAAAAPPELGVPSQDEFAAALLGPGDPSQSARLAAPVAGGSQQFSQVSF